MKVNVAATLDGILSGVKINRIKDRDTRSGLLKGYLAVHRIAKEAQAEKEEIAAKFREDWAEELAPVQAFRDKGLPVEGHEAYLEAEADAVALIEAVYAKDVEVDLPAVKAEHLYDPDIWAEDITLGQIPGTIDFLVQNGLAQE